jgi:hypothetical protein
MGSGEGHSIHKRVFKMSPLTHGFNDQELAFPKPPKEAMEFLDALRGPPITEGVGFLSDIRVPQNLLSLRPVRRKSDDQRHISTQRH